MYNVVLSTAFVCGIFNSHSMVTAYDFTAETRFHPFLGQEFGFIFLHERIIYLVELPNCQL